MTFELVRFHFVTFHRCQNRGAERRTFELSVKFFLSKAKLADGSLRNIEHDTLVSWEVDFAEIDPQDLVNQEEKAVRNVVEKIGESVPWGPQQEVALVRFEEWKGEYVRMEDGKALVDEIDRQDGWTSKRATFLAELVDLKSDSRVGYVPSKLAMQIADDEWAASRQIMPIVTEVTVLADDAQEGSDGAANVAVVD